MEQAAVNLLSTMAAAKPAVPNVGRNNNAASAATEDFQTMLDKRQKSDDKPVENKQAEDAKPKDQENVKEAEKVEDANTKQEQTQDAVEDDTAVQAQAIWAAMSVMNPTVVQQPEAPVEEQAVEVVTEVVEAISGVRVEEPVIEQPTVEEVPQQAQGTVPEVPAQKEAEAEIVPQEAGAATEVKAEVEVEAEPQTEVKTEGTEVKAEPQTKVKTEGTEVKAEQTAESKDSSKAEAETVETDAKPVFRDVESAPIKVGEAQVADKAPEAKPVDRQIMEPLVQAMTNGETKVVVNLTPENLGSVKIELVHTESGALRVLLSADSAETRGLLEKHAMGLQAMLSKSDHEGVQVEVERQQESQQHNGHYDGENGSRQEQQSEQHQGHNSRRESEQRDTRDFLQQLRLGLVPADGEK